jgi:hypothetical protein
MLDGEWEDRQRQGKKDRRKLRRCKDPVEEGKGRRAAGGVEELASCWR